MPLDDQEGSRDPCGEALRQPENREPARPPPRLGLGAGLVLVMLGMLDFGADCERW